MRHIRLIMFATLILTCALKNAAQSEDCLLYSVRMDGTGLRLEVEPDLIPEYSVYGSPDISRDGNRLVFDANPGMDVFKKTKILVMDIAGKSKGEVLDLDCGNCPVWSPDGKQIAFSVNPDNPNGFTSGTWIINADGGNPTWICDGRLPIWTPDGKSLVVNVGNLMKVDIETKDTSPFLPEFTHLNAGIRQRRWSPDGKRVLSYIRRFDERQLATIAEDGTQDSVIVLATGELDFYVYSQDGRWVSFVRGNEQGGNDIFVVAADGKSAPRKLDVVPTATKEDFCWMKTDNRIMFNAPGKLVVE